MGVNEFVARWSSTIKRPIVINHKQGFLLDNGTRLFFDKPVLNEFCEHILKNHLKRRKV